MASLNIQNKSEELSEALVFTEPSDHVAVGDLYARFKEIKQWTDESADKQFGAVSTAALQILEDILLEEVADEKAALELINSTVIALQAVVRDGISFSGVEFPPELGLKSNGDPKVDNNVHQFASGITHPIGLPSHVDEEIYTEYLSQQGGALQELEVLILSLEQSDGGNGVRDLLGLLHTMKGESALMGLTDVEQLCHQTEDYLNEVKPAEAIDNMLSVKDWLQTTFNAYSGNGNGNVAPVQDLLSQLSSYDNGAPDKTKDPTSAVEKTAIETKAIEDPVPAAEIQPQTLTGDLDLLTDFVSEANEHLEEADAQLLILETTPDDSGAVDTIFRSFHTLKGVAGFLELDDIGTLAHKAENLLDLTRRGKLALEGPAIDITFEAVDTLKRMIDSLGKAITSGSSLVPEKALSRLLEQLEAISVGKVSATPTTTGEESTYAAQAQEPEPVKRLVVQPATEKNTNQVSETAVIPEPVKPPKTTESITPPGNGGVPVATKSTAKLKETLKVDTQRIDLMVDTIGELVIAESMVSQSAELKKVASPTLTKHLSQLDKITRELQSMGTSLRMVTIRSVFQKMARLVRDLSKKSGKQVEFVCVGEDTEVDKTVVDKIGDPLVHMIRNAVDHGIENNRKDRIAAGKKPTGKIELRAFHRGGNIYIEVEDDGQGLNRDAIMSKALEKGLMKEGASLTDSEVWSMVLEPGFSTAKKVTEISGRGVGMDVVKRNIEALRGKVEITSETGKGSVFSIRLPLTLAVIDGMIVRVGTNRYIVPTLSVKESLQPDEKSLSTVLDQGEMLTFHDRLIPILHLNRLFQVSGAIEKPTEALVIVIESDGNEAGLVIDELLGQQQVVIKSLGETMRDISGLSGCTIMPDGQVGLILDVNSLIKDSNDGNYA